jgi:hypothetical protein
MGVSSTVAGVALTLDFVGLDKIFTWMIPIALSYTIWCRLMNDRTSVYSGKAYFI